MLTELAVKNYKSLKDIKLSLGPLVVLIGPNGSGKSNLLDVLKLVQQFTNPENDIGGILADRGGYTEIVWGGERNRDIDFLLTWQAGNSSSKSVQSYSICIGYDEQRRNAIFFKTERVVVDGSELMSRTDSDYKGYHTSQKINAWSSIASMWRRLDSPNILEFVYNSEFYRFSPLSMRHPRPVRREYRLTESGENLSTVIHTLFSDGDPTLKEIVEILKACVPTVEDLRSPITEDGRTYVALKEESVPKPVGSWGLSDGTLLALALATALMTPQPPSLIGLEAPDIELHPHVMETLAEMLKLASSKTQVITTTHSPYLLDFLPPESFVVVEKVKGATQFKQLKTRKDMQRVIKDLGAGKAWYSGHIGGVP